MDFAAWCSYKYLNAGPGAVAGAFVHERHHADTSLPRLAGWWGTDPATRFRMTPDFIPIQSADAWQASNPPILSTAPLIASLDLFDRAGSEALLRKSQALTAYMEQLIRTRLEGCVQIVTPVDAARRGCQLSLLILDGCRDIERRLARAGVVVDFREPNIIRAAPVPLYNTFHDVQRFVTELEKCVSTA
jgi:kynureninase